MNYELIFYRSGKTGEIQLLTEDMLGKINFQISGASACADKNELSETIARSLKRSRLIVIAGRDDGSKDNVRALITKILKPKAQKSENNIIGIGEKLYYLKSGKQMILILPDQPELIEKSADEICKTVAGEFSQSYKAEKKPDIELIGSKLSEKLEAPSRIKVMPYGSNAEKTNEKKLRLLKIVMISLLSLGILEFAAAVILFFTGNIL